MQCLIVVIPAEQVRRWRLGGSRFEASPDKKRWRDPISTNKLGMVVHICHPSYTECTSRRIEVQAGPGIKRD
jgi:hypothetical protein